MAAVRRHYKEEWGINYKTIIYPAKYIKNIVYIYIQFFIKPVKLSLNNNIIYLFL